MAIWSSAAHWMVKTREMRESSAERRALDAELKRALVAADAETGVEGRRAEAAEADLVEGIIPTTPAGPP